MTCGFCIYKCRAQYFLPVRTCTIFIKYSTCTWKMNIYKTALYLQDLDACPAVSSLSLVCLNLNPEMHKMVTSLTSRQYEYEEYLYIINQSSKSYFMLTCPTKKLLHLFQIKCPLFIFEMSYIKKCFLFQNIIN